MVSPSKQRQKRLGSVKKQVIPPKKSRRIRNLKKIDIINIHDSGSDGDNDVDSEKSNDNDNENDDVDFAKMRRNTKNEDVAQAVEMIGQKSGIENESVLIVIVEGNVNERERAATKTKGSAGKSRKSKAVVPLDANFSWSEDYSSFTGKKETYQRVKGPTFSSQDPTEIFHEIWDHDFMEMVVRETNTYAWEVITQYLDPDMDTPIPDDMKYWTDVTVEEMYRYFTIHILLSLCHRSHIQDYWSTGILGMTKFRRIMPRNRFFIINSFLHFVSNEDLLTRGHDRKIEEVAPILDHCNRKFAKMYTPSQYLSLDESLLFGKSRQSWKQCRSKAVRSGIKSLELCEAETGYLLQYRLYTDKKIEMHPEPLHGFQDHTSKIVLDLIEGYLDVGHVLVMDNWYNQLPLTRYLKTRRTDVLGTINRQQQGIPGVIKDLTPDDVLRGTTVSRHSGDIALVAHKDLKLVTVISTYHQHEMCLGRRSGQDILEPAAVEEYNRYKGGVDLKDKNLSMFPMETQRTLKLYMQVFRRLLNTSLLNAFIIYNRNRAYRKYSHIKFRLSVTEGLLRRYPPVLSVPCRVMGKPRAFSRPHEPHDLSPRLQPGNHFPVFTDNVKGGKRKQLRCVRCTALKRRTAVTVRCELCQVPLCLGPCWKDYHTVIDLKSSER